MTKEKKQKLAKKKRINFWNFQTTNPATKIFIILLRMAMIFFWILAPIFMAISYFYDDGMKNFTGYAIASVFSGQVIAGGEINFDNVVGDVELARKIIAPIIWIVVFLVSTFTGLLPYFSKTLYHERIKVVVSQFICPLFFIGVLWLLWYTSQWFPTGPESELNGVIYPKYQYWVALQQTFKPWSNWLIVYQIALGGWVVFGCFTIVEVILLKKKRLDFLDFFSEKPAVNSLVDSVVEGRIVFGENSARDVNAELKAIKKKQKKNKEKTALRL
ncbi:hypothetical protein SCLARK_001655 [Spiroplasma clarkii]|uniref:hypothetical protein n=1 Tax=Spiroplasma clarkii TaxID=2139 RepID=UPI000B577209|nr:hypothetical protein [Spiroplasma clarkii]ARU92123.1 hypothetical protein SCLARK_001655 [Spiroplasma clarkii]